MTAAVMSSARELSVAANQPSAPPDPSDPPDASDPPGHPAESTSAYLSTSLTLLVSNRAVTFPFVTG